MSVLGLCSEDPSCVAASPFRRILTACFHFFSYRRKCCQQVSKGQVLPFLYKRQDGVWHDQTRGLLRMRSEQGVYQLYSSNLQHLERPFEAPGAPGDAFMPLKRIILLRECRKSPVRGFERNACSLWAKMAVSLSPPGHPSEHLCAAVEHIDRGISPGTEACSSRDPGLAYCKEYYRALYTYRTCRLLILTSERFVRRAACTTWLGTKSPQYLVNTQFYGWIR